MSIDRRGFLGSITSLFVIPKNLITQQTGGMVFSSRLISSDDDYSKLQAINNSVLSKPPHLEIFTKKNIEPFVNSEDTSIIFQNFGVNIYVDPSGIFTNEK